jgi:hypothetical protein
MSRRRQRAAHAAVGHPKIESGPYALLGRGVLGLDDHERGRWRQMGRID